MDAMSQLRIEHTCQRLMALYCRHLDHLDPEAFANLYTEDAIYKPAAEPEPIVGRPAILAWVRAYPKHRLGRHLSTNQVVDVLDPESATGWSYAVVFREPDPQEGVVSPRVTPRSVVEYRDEFRHTAEGWRIASRIYQIHFLQAEEPNRPTPVS